MFIVSVVSVAKAWKDWFDTDAPEEATIPDGYSSSLDTFHRLLLIRSWCPDRTLPMAKIYVAETMGKQVRLGSNRFSSLCSMLRYKFVRRVISISWFSA